MPVDGCDPPATAGETDGILSNLVVVNVSTPRREMASTAKPAPKPITNAVNSRATAISMPVTPAVYANSEGFMRGEAMMKDISGPTGTPRASRAPTIGMAANVHIGEITPSTLAATIDPPTRCLSNRAALSFGRKRHTRLLIAAPSRAKYHSCRSSTQKRSRIRMV